MSDEQSGASADKPDSRGEGSNDELLVVVGSGYMPGVGFVLIAVPAKEFAKLEAEARKLERRWRHWRFV